MSEFAVCDLFNMLSHHGRIPSLTCPIVAGLSSALWARGVLQRDQRLRAALFPPGLGRHWDFYQLCKAEGRCPCNGVNPVYLFLFIILKYEMFALYNHPPPDVAQGSSASTIPSVHPKRRCLRRRLNRPRESEPGRRVIPQTDLSLEKWEVRAGFSKT